MVPSEVGPPEAGGGCEGQKVGGAEAPGLSTRDSLRGPQLGLDYQR